MDIVTVSPKYQVVIPKAVRETIKIQPGEKVVMFEKDGVIHLIQVQDIQKLRGRYKKLSQERLRDDRDRF